jgi:hypothetical protein
MRDRGNPGRSRLAAALAAVTLTAAAALTGCAALGGTVPSCGDPLKLAIIAQSVTGTAYVPCITQLPPGWSTSEFDPASGGTSFTLNSDRSPGRPVTVRLAAKCQTGGASPSPPRAPGVLSYTRLTSISPGFAGTLYDVFPGGCVSYQFDFTQGPHIAQMSHCCSRSWPRAAIG